MRFRGIKPLNFNWNEIILAAAVFLVFTTILCYKFIFVPQWENVRRLQGELTQKRELLDTRVKQGWNDIPALKRESGKIQADINDIYQQVPNIKNEPLLLVDFYRLSRQNMVEANTITFGEKKEVESKNYSSFTVSTEISGYNTNIYNFLEAIENYPRRCRIVNMEFVPRGFSHGTCSLTVEFFVFSEVQPDPLHYTFLSGKTGRDFPYQVFGSYNSIFPDDDTKGENNTSGDSGADGEGNNNSGENTGGNSAEPDDNVEGDHGVVIKGTKPDGSELSIDAFDK